MSLLAVLYATVGAAKEWFKRGCRAVWGIVTAPARLVTKIAAASSSSSLSSSSPPAASASGGASGGATEKESDSDADNR